VLPQSRGLDWGDLSDDEDDGGTWAAERPPVPASARLDGTAMLAVRFPLELPRALPTAEGWICGLAGMIDDELMQGLCRTYKGLGVDEVEQALLASVHADAIVDSHLLAEYIVACCEAY
jgi:hypothetical protein